MGIIFDLLCSQSKSLSLLKETVCEEMINDLKFSFACQSKSKPGRKKKMPEMVDNTTYNSLSQPKIITNAYEFNKTDY